MSIKVPSPAALIERVSPKEDQLKNLVSYITKTLEADARGSRRAFSYYRQGTGLKMSLSTLSQAAGHAHVSAQLLVQLMPGWEIRALGDEITVHIEKPNSDGPDGK